MLMRLAYLGITNAFALLRLLPGSDRGWPRCCANSPDPASTACGYRYDPTPSCADTPAPHRTTTTWTQFLRLQADALPAADFIETTTLTGARTSTDATASAASSTSTNTPPDQRGWHFRQVQRSAIRAAELRCLMVFWRIRSASRWSSPVRRVGWSAGLSRHLSFST
jgi:hypothetical protein